MTSPQRKNSIKSFIELYAFPIILVLIPFSFPYPQLIFFNLLTILLFVLWSVKGSLKERIQLIGKSKTALLFMSTYVIYILCLFYSQDIHSGNFLLEKKAVILLFPIILSTEKISESLLKKILLSFVLTCFLATILSGLHSQLFLKPIKLLSVSEFRESFREFLNLDPPYFGLYITFSVFVVVYYLFKEWSTIGITIKLLGLMLLGYFIIINILLSSRISIISIFFLIIVFTIYLLQKKWVIGILLLLLIASIGGYSIKRFTFLSSRFTEIFQTEWAAPVGVYYNSTNLRIGCLECSFQLLRENWLFGLGTGSVQQNLNNCYKSRGFSDVMYIDEYNTHNEYLNVWLNTGLIGFVLFILSLLIPLIMAIIERHFLYLAFLGLILISMLTESLLERQKGIIFYAFFNSLFAFYSIGKSLTKQKEKLL